MYTDNLSWLMYHLVSPTIDCWVNPKLAIDKVLKLLIKRIEVSCVIHNVSDVKKWANSVWDLQWELMYFSEQVASYCLCTHNIQYTNKYLSSEYFHHDLTNWRHF